MFVPPRADSSCSFHKPHRFFRDSGVLFETAKEEVCANSLCQGVSVWGCWWCACVRVCMCVCVLWFGACVCVCVCVCVRGKDGERERGKNKTSHPHGAPGGTQGRRRLLKDSVRQPPQLAWAPGPMELRVVKGRTSNNALKVDTVRTSSVACVVAAMAVACIKAYSVGEMMCAVRCSNGW